MPHFGDGKAEAKRSCVFQPLGGKTSKAGVSNPCTIYGECTVGPNSRLSTTHFGPLVFSLGCQKGLLEEVRSAEEGSTPREALPKSLESSEAKAGGRDSGK